MSAFGGKADILFDRAAAEHPLFQGLVSLRNEAFFIARSLRKLFCAMITERLRESHCAKRCAMRFPSLRAHCADYADHWVVKVFSSPRAVAVKIGL
jgi:hypothetical protein